MLPAAPNLPVGDVANVCCHGCGVYDASLRYSEHPAITSFLLGATESARVGIWCAKCRGIAAAKAIAVSLLAGWWSLRGPKLTIAAIRTNLQGGRQPAQPNAQMLRAIAQHEYENSNPEMAAMFARAAHAAQPQRENSRMLDTLKKAGHRGEVANSSWRFAPFAPLAVFAIVVIGVGLKVITGGHAADIPTENVQRAGMAAVRTAHPSQPAGWTNQTVQANLSADELEKQLTPDSDAALARRYLQARLGEARADIPLRIRRGDDLWAVDSAIRNLRDQPSVARLLERPPLSTAYQNLLDTMMEATRYYHGGAPVEAIQRTAGESLNVTFDIALAAIDSEMRGHTERSDALGSQFDARADSLLEMKRDLRIRGAVIALTTRAIDACLAAAR